MRTSAIVAAQLSVGPCSRAACRVAAHTARCAKLLVNPLRSARLRAPADPREYSHARRGLVHTPDAAWPTHTGWDAGLQSRFGASLGRRRSSTPYAAATELSCRGRRRVPPKQRYGASRQSGRSAWAASPMTGREHHTSDRRVASVAVIGHPPKGCRASMRKRVEWATNGPSAVICW